MIKGDKFIMYLVKKISKSGKTYYVLVVLNGFNTKDSKGKSYVNLTEDQGDFFIAKFKLQIYEDKK